MVSAYLIERFKLASLANNYFSSSQQFISRSHLPVEEASVCFRMRYLAGIFQLFLKPHRVWTAKAKTQYKSNLKVGCPYFHKVNRDKQPKNIQLRNFPRNLFRRVSS